MSALTIVLVCLFCAAGIGRYLMGSSERRMLAEMSDAVIRTYAIWEEDGTPQNPYAEEYERRAQAKRKQSCKN